MPRAIEWLRPMLAIDAAIVSFHEHGTRTRYKMIPNAALNTKNPKMG